MDFRKKKQIKFFVVVDFVLHADLLFRISLRDPWQIINLLSFIFSVLVYIENKRLPQWNIWLDYDLRVNDSVNIYMRKYILP